MQPEAPSSDKTGSIYQTLLNRNQGGNPGSGFLNDAILRALKRSYISFSKRFPELVEYIFDSLGNKIIASEVIKLFSPEKQPSPNVITRAWADLLPYPVYEQSSPYLLEAATTFIELIYFDFLKEPVLKPLLKHKYDVSMEQLADDLTNPPEPKNSPPNRRGREKAKPAADSEPSESDEPGEPDKPGVEVQPEPIEDRPGITRMTLAPGAPVDLTPDYLSQRINPYLIAVANLQLVVNEILERPAGKVLIKSISQSSPITISLDGAADAVRLIMEIIIPWRQKNALAMAQLQEQETQSEIESKKAEILEKRARSDKDRADASQQRAEAEKVKLESEKLRVELNREKFQLGLEMLNSIRSDIPRDDKITLLTKLVPQIEMISLNELDISILK